MPLDPCHERPSVCFLRDGSALFAQLFIDGDLWQRELTGTHIHSRITFKHALSSGDRPLINGLKRLPTRTQDIFAAANLSHPQHFLLLLALVGHRFEITLRRGVPLLRERGFRRKMDVSAHVVVRHVSVVQTRFRAQASWPSESHSSLIKTGELARGHDPLPFKLLHQLVYWLLCFIVSGLKLGPWTQSIGIALLII